jgi:predicted transcriptional regulator
LPYAVRFDESSPQIDWEIDEYGNIVDEIDKKVEKLVEGGSFLTVSHVAKKLHCSNGDARISLERLVRIGSAEKFQYGPQNRWVGYRKKGFG